MRINNYSYKPSFQRLDMDEKTTEYIAKNTSRADLQKIAQTCNLLQNSILIISRIDGSIELLYTKDKFLPFTLFL